VSFLPEITLCKKDAASGCKTINDLGQALIDGRAVRVYRFGIYTFNGFQVRRPIKERGIFRDSAEEISRYCRGDLRNDYCHRR
jgi:hypothetical protein